MVKINENYQKLPGSYLFSEVARRISVYSAAHPEARIIKLSIGDVTRPLAPAVIQAMQKAVEEKRAARVKRAAGTRVNFFTMVRGED